MTEIRVPAKWVLAGEHTVLHGGTAVALPHPEFFLVLRVEPGAGEWRIEPASARDSLSALFARARDWFEKNAIAFVQPTEKLRLESSIPEGAGLGSSAAFSVAIARWLLARANVVDSAREIELARVFEDHFHGQSSGMDVSVVSLAEPIAFSMKEGARKLGVTALPKFRFRDTGLRASTKECIRQVETFRERNPSLAAALDAEMSAAARLAETGLAAYSRGERVSGGSDVAKAMKRAHEVFRAWGIVSEEVARTVQEELAHGALAARLTGAGRGGFVVSLENVAAQ